MNRFTALLCALMVIFSCNGGGIKDGDIVFVFEGASAFDGAISSATADATADASFTHVGIVYGNEVLEARPDGGVVRTSWESFTRHNPAYVVCRLNDIDTEASYRNILEHMGETYDFLYMPDNGRMYCSELLQVCVVKKDGTPAFDTIPMNFLAPDGTLPDFWRKLFEKEGVEVPQGCPGTNPNQLFKSIGGASSVISSGPAGNS